MGSVIKGNKYRLIDNRSFEMPLPVRFELLKEDDLIAFYEVSTDENVTVRIMTKNKENMLTPINRPLELSDIHYFFSSRVFQNGTPFTAIELQLVGVERYNAFDIVRKTRGVTPYDTYWLRFEGDRCNDYFAARTAWEGLVSGVKPAEKQEPEQELDPFAFPDALRFTPTATKELDSEEKSHVSDILSQHKMDYSERLAQENEKAQDAKSESVSKNTMSEDEIEALLQQSGISAEPAPEEPKSSGGVMSDDEIAKMLASVNETYPEEAQPTPEPAPVEEPKSGGKMSQDDIEKMLAAAKASEPEPTPAPVEEPKSSGKMSQDDIEKMLAAAEAQPTPEPTPEPAPVEEPKSGGKMSQDDIEKMLAAAAAEAQPTPESTPEPAPVEEPKSSGKMSQDDIEKMLAAVAAEPEPEPAPVEEPKSSGGTMSEADIEALLNGMKEDAGQ